MGFQKTAENHPWGADGIARGRKSFACCASLGDCDHRSLQVSPWCPGVSPTEGAPGLKPCEKHFSGSPLPAPVPGVQLDLSVMLEAVAACAVVTARAGFRQNCGAAKCPVAAPSSVAETPLQGPLS